MPAVGHLFDETVYPLVYLWFPEKFVHFGKQFFQQNGKGWKVREKLKKVSWIFVERASSMVEKIYGFYFNSGKKHFRS